MLKTIPRTYNLKEAQAQVWKFAKRNGLDYYAQIAEKLRVSTTTIAVLLQDNLPMEKRPTNKTIRMIFLEMGLDPAYLFDREEDKSVPVNKTVVKPAETRPERKYPVTMDASRTQWKIGVTIDDTKEPPTIVMSVTKNGAVITYAKAKLLHDDDVGFIKDLSYTLHLAYKNAEQKSL